MGSWKITFNKTLAILRVHIKLVGVIEISWGHSKYLGVLHIMSYSYSIYILSNISSICDTLW